jgi:hypothetical protein
VVRSAKQSATVRAGFVTRTVTAFDDVFLHSWTNSLRASDRS